MGVAAAAPARAAKPGHSYRPAPAAAFLARPTSLLAKRACDCGVTAGLSGHCENCERASLKSRPATGSAADVGSFAPGTKPGLGLDLGRLGVSSAASQSAVRPTLAVAPKALRVDPLAMAPAPVRPASPASVVRQASPVRVQTQMRVSSPADSCEREAQCLGKMIARMPDPDAKGPSVQASESGTAQRETAPAISDRSGEPPTAYRLESGGPADPDVLAGLRASTSGGASLPADLLSFMEPRFRADFSGVRLRTDAHAARISAQLGARAFTVGKDIYFAKGEFRPDTPDGWELIAHELTHTIQQGGVKRSPPAAPAAEKPAAGPPTAAKPAAAALAQAVSPPPSAVVKPPAAAGPAPIPRPMPPAPVAKPADAKAPGAVIPLDPTARRAPRQAPRAPAPEESAKGGGAAASALSAPSRPRAAAPAPAPLRSAPAPAVAVHGQLVQRQEAPAPTPAPASSPSLLESFIGASADVLWALVKQVAPAALIDMIQAVRSKGIVGYLHDKLAGVFGRLFGGLNQGDPGFVAGLVASFTSLMGTARTILAALAHNDCKPLFDAIGKLGDALGEMAGAAWDKLKAFLAPVGDFFSGLWTKFGAPAVDFLSNVAGDVWNEIKSVAAQLWDAASRLVSPAWNWLKAQLGIGDDAGGQNGLLQWVEAKLGQAWDGLKSLLDPVIAPIKAFGAKVAAVLPIDAILNLRERVHDWLQHAGSMVTSLQKPDGVTEDQTSLREKLLPAVKAAIVSLGGKISDAGGWVADQVGGLVQLATGMLASLKSNSVLGAVAGAIDWVGEKIRALGDWAQEKVHGLFDLAGQAVAKLSGFVDPVLRALQTLAHVIGNVVKALPDLVLGPAWALIPACIKDPIKDFIIKHILSEIPIISTFVKLPDIWTKIQKLVLDFLATVFVKGDLSGAALMVIRFVLEAAGVDFNLFLRVLGKVFSVLDDIMMHPLNFLKNIGAAVIGGFRRFWDNIKVNMVNVLQTWLLAPLAKYGVTPLADLSLGSIFKLVLQVLGLTEARIRAKLEKALGPKVVGVLEAAWRWISALFTKGPAALWEEVKASLADLSTIIIGGITNWISTDLVEAGLKKLAKLSNPVGEVIELIQTISKTIDFIVTKMNSILTMVDSVLNSLAAIVAGQIGPASEAIEKALVGAIANVLSFLADWTDTKVGERVLEIIKKIQARVDKAVDGLIAKAIAIVQKLSGTGKPDQPDDPKWNAAVIGVNKDLQTMEAAYPDGRLSDEELEAKLPTWKATYGLSSLRVAAVGDKYEVIGAMSPEHELAEAPAAGDGHDKQHPIDFAWVKPALADYKPITLAPPDQVAAAGGIWGHLPLSTLQTLNGAFGVSPTMSHTLTKLPIGVAPAYRITQNFTFEAKPAPPRGGTVGRFNNELKDWGYNRNDNVDPPTDADHVLELQLGGPDDVTNLWPLKSSVNQDSGRKVLAERKRVMTRFKLNDLDKRWIRLKL